MTSLKSLLPVAATAVCLAFGSQARAQDYPDMDLRLAHAFPEAYVQSGVDKWWAQEIEQRSGGKIKIQILWAGSGGAPLEILELVGSGAVDLGAVPAAYFSNELPLIGAPNALPTIFRTNAGAVAIAEGLVENVPAVEAELKRNNVWPLFFHTLNTYAPLCTKPVATMADFQGLKIRSFGAYQPALWSSLGAIGVDVLPAEIYEGLQRGRIDCGFFSNDLYLATKLYEVAKYLTTADFGPVSTWPIWVNYEEWQSWPADVRALFEEVSAEASLKSLEALAAASDSALQKMQAAGVQVVEFTEMDKLRQTQPDMLALWREEMAGKGRGAEADAVIAYWKARQAEVEPKN